VWRLSCVISVISKKGQKENQRSNEETKKKKSKGKPEKESKETPTLFNAARLITFTPILFALSIANSI
jgi:hypothetical protein